MLKIGLISLGCSKNQVDSEIILGFISENNQFKIVEDLENADIIIVNTCGFIQDAKEESIETILEAAQLKKSANLKGLIVTGCLTQRYKDKILKELPEVDAILGTGTFGEINQVIKDVLKGERINKIADPAYGYKASLSRVITNSHFAYVKIAEGCNNNCSYCSIPKIRGPYYSRPIDDIIEEVNALTQQGVKEIILIAQDITRYGEDIYGKPVLTKLLKEILAVSELQWLRLMYSYPENIDQDLIDLISKEERICNYLDLPIQHSSNKIRKLMYRRGTREDLINLISKLRKSIPDIAIRTSLIVGFPGESEEDYKDLANFVKEIKFDRLGVFKYSKEEDTAAADFEGHISDKLKTERYNKLMQIQQKISYDNNQRYIGRYLELIIDEINNDTAYARSKYDAPEIDNQIYLPAEGSSIGQIVKCKIKEAYEYDLIGELKNEFSK
ncbi:30S ribosomal protein S12 methylthiotransferase RimO [Natronospora cellulosivora (SeqCode)]